MFKEPTFLYISPETCIKIVIFYARTNLLPKLAALLLDDLLACDAGSSAAQQAPVFRLGRLATALRHQGKGIGEFMLFGIIDRATRISGEIGGVGLVVNAKLSAVEFYQRYGFEPMADHPQNLFLPL